MTAVRATFSCVLLILAFSQYKAGAQELVAANNALGTTGGQKFDQVMGLDGALKVMSDSINFIFGALYSDGSVPKPTRSKISFYVDDQPGAGVVAFTTGQGDQSEIHLSEAYVGSYQGDVAQEITGVLYHEMTHVWQWNGQGQAPSGLIEGYADYIRLTAGFAPSNWGKPGEGNRWDQGYDVTAYFLQYCEGLKSGFVAALNAKLASGWSEDLFNQLLGQSVQQLWTSYKQKFGSS
ncbi:hypothetical protein O6H91_13G004800 [Diphasiastrum complanatum]|uniref:Uncharacterized protein n=4 Tax=Diphasiastrum complanatum TaxID=34168 RepID=A0ACC2BRT7_DIPCM|nr:hypothetical protein O6H91_13G004200 [Diphasiastrum complanatum]KAJ7532470.1 hypothetical protein O6H91_13G004800 [Diphasiastrum complanatum]